MSKEADPANSPAIQSSPSPPSRKNSIAHADILNFVTKQQSKSIATKELFCHLIFTVIFLTVVALQRSVFESYLMNQSLSAVFITQQIDPSLQTFPKTFLDVGQYEELRDYLVSVVGGTLDNGVNYSGLSLTPYQRNFFMSNNRLLGGVRFRQLRAAPNRGCKVPNDLKDVIASCYASGYSDRNKDTAPFGPPSDPQRYKYQTAAECGSTFIYTDMLYGLDGGGYVVDMPLGSNFTEAIQELVAIGWWDSGTRAIVITMNFLSVDLDNRIAVMYLVMEMPGNGEVVPSVTFKTFRLDLYTSDQDWFRLALEIVFVIILVHMIVREAVEIRSCYASKRGLRKYLSNGWNLNEVVTISLFLAAIGAYLNYVITAYNHPNLAADNYFPHMEQLATKAWTYYNITYFNVLLLSFQTFKYLRMNRRLYMLWKTLQHAGTDLFGFLFIFLIFVVGFVFMAWLTFGAEMPVFSTFNLAFGTCWNFLIGNPPDYNAMVQTNPILGPIFFTLFTIFIFFILANVFIAIVGDSFSVVSKSVSDQVGIKEALNSKLTNCFRSTKKLATKITKRSSFAKRSILQILESLSSPEVLEKPGLTIDDIFRACGPDTTEAEAWELFEWIEKLESKKKQQTLKSRRNSEADLDLSDDDRSAGVEMKPVQKSDYLELLASVDALREDMQRLLLLIPTALQPPQQPLPQTPSPPQTPLPPQSAQQRSRPLQPSQLPALVLHDHSPRAPTQDVQQPPSPPEYPRLARARDSIGPPPPSPQIHIIPPLSFGPLQAAQQTQGHAHGSSQSQSPRGRESIGPPPPTPSYSLRNSSHHIPAIPPHPHDHQHSHHHRSHSHDHTHGLLQVPPSGPWGVTTSISPVISAPPSPTLRTIRMSTSPKLSVPIPIDPPLFVLDPPYPETSTTPRKRLEP